MFGSTRFLFLSVVTFGLFPVYPVLKAVGRSVTGSEPKRKKHELIPVILNAEQIAKALEANGKRRQITHALICGPHGQIFGTEKHCLEYCMVWRDIFPALFSKGVETTDRQMAEYRSTFDLVDELGEAHDSLRSETIKPGMQAQ